MIDFITKGMQSFEMNAYLSLINLMLIVRTLSIIIKSFDHLRAKKTFIGKKLGHTMVSAIKASSVTL